MSRKILWHSNAPWSVVGYGVETGLFTPRIKALGYDLAISAFWGLGGSRMDWEDIEVFPSDDDWGNRMLAPYAAFHGGTEDLRECLVITLMDVWVLKNYSAFSQLRMASWVPVDHDPLPPIVHAFFAASGARPIAMSRFGQDRLQAQDHDALYVPHGVDTKLFTPIKDRSGLRKSLSIPTDAFVVGMVANNKGVSPSRKAFPEAFEAFARLLKRHSDAILYLHTEKYGVRQGLNLMALLRANGIPDENVRWVPQLELEMGIEPESMARLFATFDVLLNPSYGEGFGIPLIEAQSCGVPVIVTDFSSMPELCGAGWLVEGERWYDAGQGSFFLRPSIASIAEQLENAYDGAEGLRSQAREFALGYDADLITQTFWAPVIEELFEDPVVLEALA